MVRVRELDNTTGTSETETEYYCFIIDSLATVLKGDLPVVITSIGEITTTTTAKVSTKSFSVLSGDDPITVSESTYNFIKSALSLNGKIILGYEYDDATIHYLSNRNLNLPIEYLLIDEEADTVDETTGETVPSSQADLVSALQIVAKRKDCLVVLTTYGQSLQESTDAILREDCSYLGEDFFDEENIKPVGKYVCAYYKKDPFDSKEITAGEAVLLAVYNNIQNGHHIWEGTTGKELGEIPGYVLSKDDLTEWDIDDMQPEYSETKEVSKAPIAINAVAKEKGITIVDGNRTCLPLANVLTEESEDVWVVDTTKSQLCASSFAHNRVLFSVIKKAIHDAAFEVKGKPSTALTWETFIGQVNETLDLILADTCIASYLWEQGTTTERAKIVGTLTICPIDLVENFDISVVLTDSGTVETSVIE